MSAETSFAGAAFFKAYGFKVGAGMIGSALLYCLLPPTRPDGSFDRREFVLRLACAGVFSSYFGDLMVDVVQIWIPVIDWTKHKGAVYLLTGSPAWMISRAFALMAHKRRNKDLVALFLEWRKLKSK